MGEAFRHRILGTINFDVPFLGMHPGIISAGLSSIFRPAEENPPERDHQEASGQASHSHQNYPSAHSSVSTLDLGPPLRNDTLFNNHPNDPNYNPRFDNDVILPVRKGWENALHFIQKHSDGLVQAGRQYVKSHLEFGGTMADYPGLKKRYTRVRALEEEDEAKRRAGIAVVGRNPHSVPRVRFINFYTASTGRPKKPKSPPAGTPSGVAATDYGMSDLSLASPSQDLRLTPSLSNSVSPRISIEEHGDDMEYDFETSQNNQEMQHIAPAPLSDHELTPTHSLSQTSTAATSISLPEIPSPPLEPTPPDLDACPDEDARKAASKGHEQALKEYKRAVKSRDSVIKDRAKAEEKLAKQARKEEKKAQKAKAKEEKGQAKDLEQEMQKSGEELRLEQERQRVEAEGRRMAEAEKERLRVQRKMLGLPPDDESSETVHEEEPKETPKPEKAHQVEEKHQPEELESHRRSTSLTPSLSLSQSPPPASSFHHRTSSNTTTTQSTSLSPSTGTSTPGKKKKDRKFCILPPKDPRTGQRDPKWIRVFMKDMDEVGAHCGLFFVSETYERLVGEVADNIERWVLDDVSERAVRELESQIL
ncbi:PGAP1-like protein [Neofusicoccum parvum]|uniref:PGAP1-like protein n=1 Tax=Neofusicoccum parvum TaxID=310453 RepID=A0ACB5RX81_9PEZI|nr:PGAP1-like protein [Neofusicoccum parvum]